MRPELRRPSRMGLAMALLAAGACWVATDVRAGAQAQPRTQKSDTGIHIVPVRGSMFMLSGAGANVAASVGRDGVVLVDTGSAAQADKLLAAVHELSRRYTSAVGPARLCVGVVRGCDWWSSSEFLPQTAAPPAPRPIIGIINTSAHPDHIGGNARLVTAAKNYAPRDIAEAGPSSWIVAHENVALAMSKSTPEPPRVAMPSEVYFGTDKKLNHLNGEPVIVHHRPAAHSNGDSVVYFRSSDVLVAGEILDMSGYPRIDVARGGTVGGVLDTLNWILDIAVVEHMMEGGTMVIGARGRLADSADIAYYRDMMTIFRDRVRAWRDKGMTLAQIQAARPTKDYDPRFARNPAWTPERFVEAIYSTLEKTQ